MSEGNNLISFDVLNMFNVNEKLTSDNLEGFTWLVKPPRFPLNICDTVRQSCSCPNFYYTEKRFDMSDTYDNY